MFRRDQITGVALLVFIRAPSGKYYSQLDSGEVPKTVYLDRDSPKPTSDYGVYRCWLYEREKDCFAYIIEEIEWELPEADLEEEGMEEPEWPELTVSDGEVYLKAINNVSTTATLKDIEKQKKIERAKLENELKEKIAYQSPNRTSRIEKACQLLDEKENTKKRRIRK